MVESGISKKLERRRGVLSSITLLLQGQKVCSTSYSQCAFGALSSKAITMLLASAGFLSVNGAGLKADKDASKIDFCM